MSRPKRSEMLQEVSTAVRRFIAGVILFKLKVAEDVGINATDMQCLHVLQLEGGATPGELAGWSRLTTGGVTVVLDRLERGGFIRREPNPKDRRSWIIRPVLPALRKLEAVYASKGQALSQTLDQFDDRKLAVILDFFQKVNQAGTDRPSA